MTGASRGIGQAIALELAREGASVALNYRSGEAEAQAVADEIAKLGGTTMLVQADVANKDQARAMVKNVAEHFGRLDVLVNNAGITRDRTLRKMTDDDWDQVIKTNLGSVYYTVTAAMPIMIEQQYGRIINISSNVNGGVYM